MDQMNVSITYRLVSYVRKKVKSGRYNNASEVVREALRRMEDEDARAVRLAKPSAEDILTDLTEQQIERIRQRVRASIEAVADELACAAGLACGKLARTPACVIRGFPYEPGKGTARDLIRPAKQDLFR